VNTTVHRNIGAGYHESDDCGVTVALADSRLLKSTPNALNAAYNNPDDSRCFPPPFINFLIFRPISRADAR